MESLFPPPATTATTATTASVVAAVATTVTSVALAPFLSATLLVRRLPTTSTNRRRFSRSPRASLLLPKTRADLPTTRLPTCFACLHLN